MSEQEPRLQLYVSAGSKFNWVIARIGQQCIALGVYTGSFNVTSWSHAEDRRVRHGAYREIPLTSLPPTREVDDLRAEVKEKVRLIEDLRAEMDSESLNVQTLEAKLKHSQEKLDEADKTIKSLNQGWMNRDNLIDGLRREVEHLTTSNKALSEELGRVTSDRNYLRGKVAGMRAAQSLQEDLKGRDDTIALLNKKIVEQADQIRTMQALAGTPWVPTPTVTSVSSSQPLKFAPMPANDVGIVSLKELQKQVEQNRKDIQVLTLVAEQYPAVDKRELQNRRDIHSLAMMTKSENEKMNRLIYEIQTGLRGSIEKIARDTARQISNMDEWVRVRTAGLQHDLDRRYVCKDGKIVEEGSRDQ